MKKIIKTSAILCVLAFVAGNSAFAATSTSSSTKTVTTKTTTTTTTTSSSNSGTKVNNSNKANNGNKVNATNTTATNNKNDKNDKNKVPNGKPDNKNHVNCKHNGGTQPCGNHQVQNAGRQPNKTATTVKPVTPAKPQAKPQVKPQPKPQHKPASKPVDNRIPPAVKQKKCNHPHHHHGCPDELPAKKPYGLRRIS